MAKWGVVLDVTELRRIGDTKEVETVYRATCKSAGGIVFTEIIKDADATSAAADKILSDKAKRLDAVKSL
jgi:hypothetical protein